MEYTIQKNLRINKTAGPKIGVKLHLLCIHPAYSSVFVRTISMLILSVLSREGGLATLPAVLKTRSSGVFVAHTQRGCTPWNPSIVAQSRQ